MSDWRDLMARATSRPGIRPDDADLAPGLANAKAHFAHSARDARVGAEPAADVVDGYATSTGHDAFEPATKPSKVAVVPSIGATTVDEHFTALGGYDGAVALSGDVVTAFRLWDSHRLWLRDLGRDQQRRWDAQYREIWNRLRAKPDLHPW